MRDEWTPGPRVAADDGVELATWDLGGEGPPLLLAHATGFHARTWLPVAPPLRAHHHVWAVDQRGHGASGHAPDAGCLAWDRFAHDLVAVVDALFGGGPVAGGGHSLGGAVLLRAEELRPGTFHSLFCYEPALVPSCMIDDGNDVAGGERLSALARKRRAAFGSREEAIANYARKPPFAAFDPAVLDAYVRHGFVDEPDGSVRLACRPEEEASVFAGTVRARVWDDLDGVEPPVTVARGGDAEGVSGLADAVAARLPRGTLAVLDGLDHFGPMTAPLRVGAAMAASLAGSR